MSSIDQKPSDLPVMFEDAIKKEAAKQTAKWVLGGLVALLGFAATGWWFYLEPKVKGYIANAAGGVPQDAIIASVTECAKLAGKWAAFEEGTGRFLVGAGNLSHPQYSNWIPEDGNPKKLTEYTALQAGGEEKHRIKMDELPPLDIGGRNDLATRPTNMFTLNKLIVNSDPNARKPMNILPPYIPVYFCKKM